MIVGEDFIRCMCGSAEFEVKRIVMVSKKAEKRDEFNKGLLLLVENERYEYVCNECRRKLDM